MVGWLLGLFVGSSVLAIIGGIIGLLIGGLLAGGIAGFCQWWVLRLSLHWLEQRWIFYTALAGLLSAFPAFLLGFTSLLGMGFAGLLIGAMFGGLVGWLQGLVIRYEFEQIIPVWVLANIAAGAICGSLTLMTSASWLPMIFTPGPMIYGLVTGWMLRWLFRQQPDDWLQD